MLEDENKVKNEKVVHLNSNRIELIEYIFVTFKNNESKDKATDVFLPEPRVHKCLRRMCCISNKYQLKKEFL